MKFGYFLLSFALGIFCVSSLKGTTLSEGFPPKFPTLEKQQEFNRSIAAAFNRVLFPGPFERFSNAIQNLDRKEIEYLLNSQHIYTLEAYITKLTTQFEGTASATVRRTLKLSAEESASLLYFYKALNAEENSLVKGQMLKKSDARLAQGLKQITRWPFVPVRMHGHNLPPVSYDKSAWAASRLPFVNLQLGDDLLILRSQFLNAETSHNTYRHIAGFDKIFFQHLQQVAIKKDNPQLAKRAFLSYLATSITDPVIIQLERNDRPLQSELFGLSQISTKTVAEFGWAFSKFDREQLLRFFAQGILPRNVEAPASAQLESAMEYFTKYPKDGEQAQLKALALACKRK